MAKAPVTNSKRKGLSYLRITLSAFCAIADNVSGCVSGEGSADARRMFWEYQTRRYTAEQCRAVPAAEYALSGPNDAPEEQSQSPARQAFRRLTAAT